MSRKANKKPYPSISAGNKYIHFEGIFNPQNLSGMIIGECKIIRFYTDNTQYYEGEIMKITEEKGTESFKLLGELVFKNA